jgi:hypothetical protein
MWDVDLLDFSLALDERSIRVHLQNLLRKRTIGTLLGGSGHDDRKVEELAQGGVRDQVVAVESRVPVASHLVQTDLQVEDEEKLRIVSPKAFGEEGGGGVLQHCPCRCVPMGQLQHVRRDSEEVNRSESTITANSVEEAKCQESDTGSELHLES